MEGELLDKQAPFGCKYVYNECPGKRRSERLGEGVEILNQHSWFSLEKTCLQEPCVTHGGPEHAATHEKSNSKRDALPTDSTWEQWLKDGLKDELCYECRVRGKINEWKHEGRLTLHERAMQIREDKNVPYNQKDASIRETRDIARKWAEAELEIIGEGKGKNGW